MLRVHVKLRRRLERYGQLKQELAAALNKNESGEMTAEDEFAVREKPSFRGVFYYRKMLLGNISP